MPHVYNVHCLNSIKNILFHISKIGNLLISLHSHNKNDGFLPFKPLYNTRPSPTGCYPPESKVQPKTRVLAAKPLLDDCLSRDLELFTGAITVRGTRQKRCCASYQDLNFKLDRVLRAHSKSFIVLCIHVYIRCAPVVSDNYS